MITQVKYRKPSGCLSLIFWLIVFLVVWGFFSYWTLAGAP